MDKPRTLPSPSALPWRGMGLYSPYPAGGRAGMRAFFALWMLLLLLLGWIPQPAQAAALRDVPIPDPYALAAENASFKLYVNPSTLGFKVVDKRSGYTWNATLDEFEKTDRLNKSWKAFATSGISIEYLDAQAINKRVSITNSTVALDVKPVEQGISATVKFSDYGITIGVVLKLEENGVSVEIPADSVKEENPDFKLGLLYVYPFLGATRSDSLPGYMFIPDGSGSLIRFTAETKARNMFYGRYYGDDLGMTAIMPWDPDTNPAYKISIPVFGMALGEKQNAFISIVEKGASYGEIQAHPSGIITNFNFIYSAFIYNQSYFQATNRSGAGVTTIQRATNGFDVKIHYRFLSKDAADYVGMARSYQQYLLEKGVLSRQTGANPNIGIRLEFLGGDKEKVLLWHRLIAMTTLSQVNAILGDLNLPNPEVVYYGWQPLGATSMPPRALQLDGGLGSLSQLRALASNVAETGGNLGLYLNPQAALWNEAGYSPRNDLAMAITNVNLEGYNRNKLNYYLNLDALNGRYLPLSRDILSIPGAGLALDGIGSSLYSDFKNEHFLSREQSIQSYQKLLAENPGRLAFYQPNDYVFSLAKAYYDMPLGDSGYIYTSEAVPFLEIVLAGYLPFYGPALNFSSNLRTDLLRHVDFGVYPSFFLTQEVTAKMLNTSSNWIYTSSYAQWGGQVKQTYRWLNTLLGPVRGQEIVARRALAQGVFATTYANGKQIVVNYSEQAFSAGGMQVPARDAILREVQP